MRDRDGDSGKSDADACGAVDDFMFAAPSSSPPLVLGWWVAWIASNFISNISWRLESRSSGTDTFITGVDIVSDIANIIAAVLAIMVVRGIDRRQTERARHITYVPNFPPPPPVFRHPPEVRETPSSLSQN